MNASNPHTASDKRKLHKPYRFSYSEALTDLILIGVGTLVFTWFDLPAHADWIVVAAVCIALIATTWIFRLKGRA